MRPKGDSAANPACRPSADFAVASALVLVRGDDPPEPAEAADAVRCLRQLPWKPAVLVRGDDPPEPPEAADAVRCLRQLPWKPAVLVRGDDPPEPPEAHPAVTGCSRRRQSPWRRAALPAPALVCCGCGSQYKRVSWLWQPRQSAHWTTPPWRAVWVLLSLDEVTGGTFGRFARFGGLHECRWEGSSAADDGE